MESPLTIQQKLFGDNHVPDLVGTSTPTPATGLMTKEEIIDALKDTCVMLDEKKDQFERMINTLKKVDVENNDEPAESDNDEDVGNEDEDEEEVGE